MTLDTRAQPTSDRWSMEQFITIGNMTIVFKPYRVFSMFAVFVYIGDDCQTVYDGDNENIAIQIFNQHCSI